jgi:hypothetical protein
VTMAVNCIRQRKQWTADLSTLTDGVAEWTDSGTPTGTIAFTVSPIAISGTGNAIDGVAFQATWSNAQNPKYETLRARFQITGAGPSANPVFILVLASTVDDDTLEVFSSSVDETAEITFVPSARPVDFLASVNFNGEYEEGDSPPSISGTITFTFL